MALKKKFLLRIDPDLYGALEKWAADELRSVNAQMEFVLREALRRVGRERTRGGRDRPDGGSTPPETGSEP
jgi:hypothetical protein